MIRRAPQRQRQNRPGFTLVELLVVIVIIGILAALLVPVIAGAVKKANEARVTAEIQLLANALSSFREKFGDYPPSRIVLSETGVYPATTNNTTLAAWTAWYGTPGPFGTPDITIGELSERSQRMMKKFFGRAVSGPVDLDGDGNPDYWPDYNGNTQFKVSQSQPAAPDAGLIYLDGAECLTFFLGGIPNPIQNSSGQVVYGMSGFAKDRKYPFKSAGAATNTALSTSARENAYYEFNGDRLLDHDNDGIPGYADPYGTGTDARFYAYFVAYGTGGYDPNDVNYTEQDDSGTVLGNTFRVNFAVSGGNTTASPSPNPYTSTLPVPPSLNQATAYLNQNTYQIISAGGDRIFGPGGQFAKNDTQSKLPPPPIGQRDGERDNLTNFSTSRLD